MILISRAKVISQTPGARVVEWNGVLVTASGAEHFTAGGYRLTEAFVAADADGTAVTDYSPAARAILATATTGAEYRAAIDADAARALAEFEAREAAALQAQSQVINLLG